MFGKRAGNLTYTLRQRPEVWAELQGGPGHPDLTGLIRFYQTRWGVLTAAELFGLPAPAGACGSPVFSLSLCRDRGDRRPGPVYDPDGCLPPHRAGDLPPLFGNCGYAFQAALTDRVSLRELPGLILALTAPPEGDGAPPLPLAWGVIKTKSLH